MKFGTALSLKGVEFRYPEAAKATLRGLDLEIEAGEWIAVLGSNGSGKSTLMKLFNALLIPTQGVCLVDGRDTKGFGEAEAVRSKISIIFQNPEDQIVAAVVEEDTAFGPENLGLPSIEIQARVKDALTAVGLWDRRKAPVSALSGGQKQLLALAGALAVKPGCLLLDEAMSMLDPVGRRNFLELVNNENDNGLTIVQVTHRLEEISGADVVVVLENGVFVWRGTPEELLAQPEEALREMNFEKPPVAVLRDDLAKNGVIPWSTRADILSIRDKLCL